MGGACGLVLPAGGWRWWLRCCCEVWQGWQAVGAVQVGQGWRWCVVIVCGGLLLAWSSGAALAVLFLPGAGGRRCDLLRLRGAGVVIVATAAQRPARAGLLIRQAGQAAGGKARQKEKGQGGGAWCAAALAFCLHWRCDLLRRVRPGAYRGRWRSAPRSGAGLLALALIRAQRFQLATFQRGTGCAGGAPSGPFLPFAGGVRFSTLPGSALGVGLELSEL